jgi:SAM-dependent methyltransferase
MEEGLKATPYEENQAFHPITSFLHRQRYINLTRVLHASFGDSPIRMLDIGCNAGQIFLHLQNQFRLHYVGIDPDANAIDTANARWDTLPNFTASARRAIDFEWIAAQGPYDAVVALETFEHIPARELFRIIEFISEAEPKVFICSVPIEVGPIVMIKNFGSMMIGYHRWREYSAGETLRAGFHLMEGVPPHQTGHKGFDWRWLVYTIRHYFETVQTTNMPFRYLPAGLSTSKFIVARGRRT